MPIYLLIRMISIGIVMGLVPLSSNQATWLSLVYSLGLAHYLTSIVYSKRQFIELARQPNILVPLFSLIVLGTGVYFSRFPLLIYFALHHALNEAYILNSPLSPDEANVRAFRGSAALLHGLLYFFLLRHDLAASVMGFSPLSALLQARGGTLGQTKLLGAGLAVSYALFFYYLSRIRASLTLPALIDNCASELLGLAAVVASFYVHFTFLQVVLYHFVCRIFFPLPKLYKQDARRVLSYIGLTTVCTLVFLLISPLRMFNSHFTLLSLPPALFYRQFTLWSYIHITVSLALSNAHPQWIVDLFRLRSESKEVLFSA